MREFQRKKTDRLRTAFVNKKKKKRKQKILRMKGNVFLLSPIATFVNTKE